MSILSALESINAQLEDGESGEETTVDETMLAVMESEQEIADETDELMELDDVVEETEDAVERLEGIRDAILEHGICKSMMMAADPKGELATAGIVPAYEGLEDAPVKDENADAAVEGIVETIKNVWKKLIAIFKAIWAKIKSWFDTVLRGFKSYEAALVAMIVKLKKADLDVSKFKDIKVNTFPKAVFGRYVKCVEAMFDADKVRSGCAEIIQAIKHDIDSGKDIEKVRSMALEIDKDMTKLMGPEQTAVTGLHFTKDGSLERKASKLKRKTDTLTKLGWSVSDIEGALSSTLKLINSTKSSQKAVNSMMTDFSDMTKLLEAQTRKIDGLDDKEVRRRNSLINLGKKMTRIAQKLQQAAVSDANVVAKAALALGSGALKAQAKD